mgnify:CR=1 FL=1
MDAAVAALIGAGIGAGAWAELRTELGQLLPEATLRTIRPWVLALHVSRIRMAEAEADADQSENSHQSGHANDNTKSRQEGTQQVGPECAYSFKCRNLK